MPKLLWLTMIAVVTFGGRIQFSLQYQLSNNEITMVDYGKAVRFRLEEIKHLEVHHHFITLLFNLKGSYYIRTHNDVYLVKSMLYNDENESLFDVLMAMGRYELVEKKAGFLMRTVEK